MQKITTFILLSPLNGKPFGSILSNVYFAKSSWQANILLCQNTIFMSHFALELFTFFFCYSISFIKNFKNSIICHIFLFSKPNFSRNINTQRRGISFIFSADPSLAEVEVKVKATPQ